MQVLFASYDTYVPVQIRVPFSKLVDVYDAENSTWNVLQHQGTCGFRQAVSLHTSGQSSEWSLGLDDQCSVLIFS